MNRQMTACYAMNDILHRSTDTVISVLIDTSALRLVQPFEPAAKKDEYVWGGRHCSGKLVGFRRKKFKETDKWRRDQVEALPTISRLKGNKIIDIYIYNEINWEDFHAPNVYPWIERDAFDTSFLHAKPAIERSYFASSFFDEYIKGDNVGKFCEFLLDFSKLKEQENLIDQLIEMTNIDGFSVKNLRNISRYAEICKNLSKKHYRDAFHLWTSEVNAIGYFLTADNKFINAIKYSSPITPRSIPICPTEFLNKIGIKELDPVLIDDDRFHYIWCTGLKGDCNCPQN